MIMAISKMGIDKNASKKCPKKRDLIPSDMPARIPNAPPIVATAMTTKREEPRVYCVPIINRLSTSRPRSSVPKKKAMRPFSTQDGGMSSSPTNSMFSVEGIISFGKSAKLKEGGAFTKFIRFSILHTSPSY